MSMRSRIFAFYFIFQYLRNTGLLNRMSFSSYADNVDPHSFPVGGGDAPKRWLQTTKPEKTFDDH